MKKSLLMAGLLAMVLSACDPSAKERRPTVWPQELSDCKSYYIYDPNMPIGHMMVVRCPNSQTSTTFKNGKTNQTAVVSEGGV
jgi:hypothetical protein